MAVASRRRFGSAFAMLCPSRYGEPLNSLLPLWPTPWNLYVKKTSPSARHKKNMANYFLLNMMVTIFKWKSCIFWTQNARWSHNYILTSHEKFPPSLLNINKIFCDSLMLEHTFSLDVLSTWQDGIPSENLGTFEFLLCNKLSLIRGRGRYVDRNKVSPFHNYCLFQKERYGILHKREDR